MQENIQKSSLVQSLKAGIIILMITLLLAELSLRAFHSVKPLFIFHDNSYSRFRGKPFSEDYGFKLNSLGFKDGEFAVEKNQNYRIIALGDSYAFGIVPYQDNYLTLLEKDLKQLGKPVELYNMGIPAIGPKEYLALLVREGLQYHPDMVLLSIFLGNDVLESDRPRRWYSHSYVGSLIHYLIASNRKYDNHPVHLAKEYCDDCPFFNEEAYLKLQKERGVIYKPNDAKVKIAYSKFFEYLEEIKKITDLNHIKLVVLLIPDETQVNSKLQSEVKAALSSEGAGWDITQPNRLLAEKLTALQIDYLDLYPAIEAEAKVRPLFRPRDTHWNIAGNHFAESIIQPYLLPLLKPE